MGRREEATKRCAAGDAKDGHCALCVVGKRIAAKKGEKTVVLEEQNECGKKTGETMSSGPSGGNKQQPCLTYMSHLISANCKSQVGPGFRSRLPLVRHQLFLSIKVLEGSVFSSGSRWQTQAGTSDSYLTNTRKVVCFTGSVPLDGTRNFAASGFAL